ncbi:kinase-like domain-containing protein [Multifurca ochricompacta]|uniref:Kinase-like domain-containing protein n=1 Tax=Multifurca ochricompacta TaxID=376703 RepID=A0AAD4M0W5_9AGAM|nr:kinase-like domain-containing protein [Multifurca ochricompacta]
MDAVRVQDNLPVMLKRLFPEEGPYELDVTQLFSSPNFVNNPRNHCVPLLDTFELDGPGSHKLMVFPLLRPFNSPKFQTFGEFVAFFTQICEGIQFMHQQNVAHRDCTANNIMFDPFGMYPNGFHPVKLDRNRNFKGKATTYTRTQRPPRYYFIDFGLSRRYTSRSVTDNPLRGGDKSAPEHKSRKRCNPFHTDIYYIGNLVRQEFMRKYYGFKFMEDLVKAMTDEDPTKRPSIEEVIRQFSLIRGSLHEIKLRSAIRPKNVPRLYSLIRQARQWVRTIQYILSRQASIPDP